jgi:RecA/RadA recombinase
MPRIIKSIVEQIEKRIKCKTEEKEDNHFKKDRFVSTGSTLLNLALTDHPDCGWQKGKMVNIIGDSASGKTFLVLTTFAEAAIDPKFNNFRLIMDDAEAANEFNIKHLFGDKVAKRIEAPAKLKGEDLHSELIEDFHANLRNAIKDKDPFIYILDSMDALDSEADQKKIEEFMKVHEKKRDALENTKDGEDAKVVKDIAGTYGMAKAKKNSDILRDCCGKLEKSDSILLIISQTRDNINPMSFEKKTRSGGKALKFYASHEIWTASAGKIKAKDRVIGVNCVIKVTKNKITGKVREVTIPIYYSYGLDNISSCIDFLLDESHWAGGGKVAINTQGDFELDKPVSRNKLIELIEEDNLEKELSQIVAKVWKKVEDSLVLKRRSKYA